MTQAPPCWASSKASQLFQKGAWPSVCWLSSLSYVHYVNSKATKQRTRADSNFSPVEMFVKVHTAYILQHGWYIIRTYHSPIGQIYLPRGLSENFLRYSRLASMFPTGWTAGFRGSWSLIILGSSRGGKFNFPRTYSRYRFIFRGIFEISQNLVYNKFVIKLWIYLNIIRLWIYNVIKYTNIINKYNYIIIKLWIYLNVK